ncbi:hypothetical protein MCUN1_002074 [Malassezia cuniculi]|uniref:Uncharacterized protein n=1 Tax=Malassezia cuniculi TaxID=948313 RepID=A0AAF0EVD3_9BASI|nr:hypothetical protein MCUN1_002074 [Malassezia cuniculi]
MLLGHSTDHAALVARLAEPVGSGDAEMLRLAFHTALADPADALKEPVARALCTSTDLRAAHYAAATLLQLEYTPDTILPRLVDLVCEWSEAADVSHTNGIDADDAIAALFSLVSVAARDDAKRARLYALFGLDGTALRPKELPQLMCGMPKRANTVAMALFELCGNSADRIVQSVGYAPCAALFAALGISVDPKWLQQRNGAGPGRTTENTTSAATARSDNEHADATADAADADEIEAARVMHALSRLHELGAIRTMPSS